MKLLGNDKLKFTPCSKSQELRCRVTLIWRQSFSCKCLWLSLSFYLQPFLLASLTLHWILTVSCGIQSTPWESQAAPAPGGAVNLGIFDPFQWWLKNLAHLCAIVCRAHSKCVLSLPSSPRHLLLLVWTSSPSGSGSSYLSESRYHRVLWRVEGIALPKSLKCMS